MSVQKATTLDDLEQRLYTLLQDIDCKIEDRKYFYIFCETFNSLGIVFTDCKIKMLFSNTIAITPLRRTARINDFHA